MEILERVLEKLGVPPVARQVYIDLVEQGEAPARLIATRLSLTRPSVYDQLKILIKFGLVVEKDRDGKAWFGVQDMSQLEKLMRSEETELRTLQEELGKAKKMLNTKTHTAEPKIRFISDREGIIQSMHDMLWDESLCLKVVWPYQEMLSVLGKEALVAFNEKRIRNDIRMRTIWPKEKRKNTFHIWEEGDEGVERRLAPESFLPRMGYTIYGDKVLFVSSARETFAFTVQSRDFAELMSLQFDMLWDISKKDTSRKK